MKYKKANCAFRLQILIHALIIIRFQELEMKKIAEERRRDKIEEKLARYVSLVFSTLIILNTHIYYGY